MDKLDMKSVSVIDKNIEKIGELFPNVVKESENGLSIDFDVLKQELSEVIVDGNKEKYQLTWPGKKEAILNANTPTSNTLRPLKDKSVNFDTTENIYIEGDNFEALRILQESYLNKIQCIYIDPPYNTGRNLIYKNDFSVNKEEELIDSGQITFEGGKLVTNLDSNGRFHSDWLNMMFTRIKLSRNLLKEDGFIILAIDENEISNLVNICDEIFGERNRVGLVSVVHKPEGRQHSKFFSPSNEFMLIYAKDSSKASFNQLALDDDKKKEFSNFDTNGNFKWKNFIRSDTTKDKKPGGYYPIYVDYENQKLSLNYFENSEMIYPVDNSGNQRAWIVLPGGFDEKNQNNELCIFKNSSNKMEVHYKIYEQQVYVTHWTNKKYNATANGTNLLKELFGNKIFDFPKSLYLLYDILKIVTNENSIIMDYFSGSATTAHAVMQLNAEDGGNRKYIMVQLPEETDEKSEAYKAGYKNICEIGQERIRRAAKKIKEETNADIDYGFRVYKLDSSNMKDVYYTAGEYSQDQLNLFESNIKEDRTSEDLLTQVMLDLGLKLDLKINEKELKNNKIYFVEENSLVACFDDNFNIDNIEEICKVKPLKLVFKDSCFKTDNDKINVSERIKKLSPETEISVI